MPERKQHKITYKLNPELRKLQSPVVLVIDGTETEYPNGAALADLTFDKRYCVQSIVARENVFVIQLIENAQINIAEETNISFF